eukprot:symbB.v1.2.016531.t1/scaffold1257.1/size128495/10
MEWKRGEKVKAVRVKRWAKNEELGEVPTDSLQQGWQGTCFMNGAHMAHCCEQPERCFGPDKDIKDKTHEDCCGSTFQELLKKSVAKELRETEDVDGLKEIYSVTEAFLNFVNYADIAAWELLAQAAGKRALAEYNAFSTFTDDMVSGNFDEERFKQRKMYVIKDVNHAAHLIENFFQALWSMGLRWDSYLLEYPETSNYATSRLYFWRSARHP